MPKSKDASTRSGRKKASETAKKTKSTFKYCPYSGEKIWITTVTLTDIRRAIKTGDCPSSSKKKELIRIPSKAEREALYHEASAALAARELQCLPPYGGRPWTVHCKLTEPNQAKPPLFRWFRGRLELACLPHLLERIAEPPRLRGKSMLEDVEEEEYIPTTALQERTISALSEVAWNDSEYGIPQVTVKYMSPNHTTWIQSRRAAYELRDELMEHTLLLDKVLYGYGARGQELKPFKPTKQQALHVGKLRFERDGLWVVGQAEAWQEQRAKQLIQLEREKEERIHQLGSRCEQLEMAPVAKRTMSALQFYLIAKRDAHRAERTAELRKDAKAAAETNMSDAEAEVPLTTPTESRVTVAGAEGPPITPAESTVATPIQNAMHGSAPVSRKKPPRMTLRDAERELREIWKTLSEEEQEPWKAKARDHTEQTQAAVAEPSEQSRPVSSISEGGPTATTRLTDVAESAAVDLIDTRTHSGSEDVPLPAMSSTHLSGGSIILLPETNPQKSDATAAPANKNEPHSEFVSASMEDERCLVSPSPPTALASEDDSAKKDEPSSRPEKAVLPKKRPAPLSRPPRQIQLSSHYRLKPDQIDLSYQAAMDHYDTVMNTVTARALHNELQDGFDLLRERGRGRFDMELPIFESPEFSFLNDIHKASWMPIVRQILGDDVVLIHKGVFLSMPGASSQEYHQDGPHLNKKQQRPCHAINVFVPLVDLHSRNGPTEFTLGTHYLNHDEYKKDRTLSPQPPAGTPVIFDYRLGHRGMANTSPYCRPIVYCTYAAAANGKEFRDSVNFSRKRYHRIGDLVEKPLSREERAKRRRQTLEEKAPLSDGNEEEELLTNEAKAVGDSPVGDVLSFLANVERHAEEEVGARPEGGIPSGEEPDVKPEIHIPVKQELGDQL